MTDNTDTAGGHSKQRAARQPSLRKCLLLLHMLLHTDGLASNWDLRPTRRMSAWLEKFVILRVKAPTFISAVFKEGSNNHDLDASERENVTNVELKTREDPYVRINHPAFN